MRALADWGEPRPADWSGPREPISTRLPPELIREIRERARSQGISVSRMMQRLLESSLEGHRALPGAGHLDLVTTLFD